MSCLDVVACSEGAREEAQAGVLAGVEHEYLHLVAPEVTQEGTQVVLLKLWVVD